MKLELKTPSTQQQENKVPDQPNLILLVDLPDVLKRQFAFFISNNERSV